jgi:hypothetical protein
VVRELTQLAGLIAAEPIDRDAALSRLFEIIRRLSADDANRPETENPT